MSDPHHAKALHIVEHTVDEGVIHPLQERDLISAISEALEEVVKAERERCAKIAETNWMVMKMYGNPYATGASNAGDKIAVSIRSRGEKDNG